MTEIDDAKPLNGTRSPDDFLRLIRRSQRGKLKIYLGYCAGVGKTYQMLLEARRLKGDGIDVAIAVVETHGRKETEALLEGLENIPRRTVSHRGIEIGEMDLDAVLARRPAVVLVDELAHTNVPGSRNAKRYQDVDEILAAGIHVISTLNVQHLESLYETVERATGIRVRERIPDRVVADADQIVNVDLTTEDLRERLRNGKVYTSERIETALEHFFRTSNLEQLRELTLRELAAQLDFRRRDTHDEDASSSLDQVMVCLSSRGPNSEALLRYAYRLAGRLNRNWYAVYVQTSKERPAAIDARTQRTLSNTLALAQQLGATVFTYKGDDVVKTILQFAREYRVGHIVIGSPGNRQPFWLRVLGRQSIVDRLAAEGRGITVVICDTHGTDLPKRTHTKPEGPLVSDPNAARAPDSLRLPWSEDPVRLWQDEIEKTLAMRQLLEACLPEAGDLRERAWERLVAREQQGGTFVGENVLLPHARVDGLEKPILAIGIGKKGIYDAQQSRRGEIMLLLLSTTTSANEHLETLARISRMACDDRWRRSIILARTPENAIDLVRRA